MGRGPKDDAAKVAKDAYEALMKGKDKVVVHSVKATAMSVLGSVLPERLKTAVHGAAAKPQDEDASPDTGRGSASPGRG